MRPDPRPQLLVDLSVLVQTDDKSGIQRVVRNVLAALLKSPPAGCVVEPVYDAGGYYAYAHGFGARGGAAAAPLRGDTDSAPLTADDTEPPQPVVLRADDIFLGLDLAPNHVPGNRALYADMRRHGVLLYFVVYDLLPITQPQMFNPGAAPWFANWVRTVAETADGLVCISRAVADELLDWIGENDVRRPTPLPVGWFHLGADIPAGGSDVGVADTAPADEALLAHVRARPSLLMVGTLEPRKMHSQALDAFEQLWRRGIDANFVIVGKTGWMTERLAERLRQHPEAGKRLFWLPRADDATLLQLYACSSALLAASAGEGFGLPLIEAAHHGLPVIARDLPVFREVAGDHAWYFEAGNGTQLADALACWLELHAAGQAPRSGAMPWLDWNGSAAALLRVLLDGAWYRTAPTLLSAPQ
ncbi:glycosyltransferase family 4 protein [Pseudoduganella umbonata]|nr:glycosyltransferase family 1 protein [Pseudoduganella umbonata]MBB3220855.1 glycosyltransferase involved in cell wall biosynthesis [Pseudoduganella umbonata]